MPVNLTSIEALVALITVIAFLISVGKWIQMREAIAQRVIEVDEQLKEINEWRSAHITDVQKHLSNIDNMYVRRESCHLHMVNFDDKFAKLTDAIFDLKKSLDKHLDDRRR